LSSLGIVLALNFEPSNARRIDPPKRDKPLVQQFVNVAVKVILGNESPFWGGGEIVVWNASNCFSHQPETFLDDVHIGVNSINSVFGIAKCWQLSFFFSWQLQKNFVPFTATLAD
jgi:hypothetical protein